MRTFPERDWKTLSRLKPLALDRLCKRILDGAKEIIDDVEKGENHDAYLSLYKYIMEQDEEVALCFNDWRRTNAMILLGSWRVRNLITDEEFAAFTPETRGIIDFLLRG
jgi:hypothetical protein